MLAKRCSRNFWRKEKRASLAILDAAAPSVCAVLLERSGVDMLQKKKEKTKEQENLYTHSLASLAFSYNDTTNRHTQSSAYSNG